MTTIFVALVPQNSLLQKLSRIKESFAETYGARHALKLPPHLTLIPPFKIKKENVPALLSNLHQTVAKTENFDLDLNGFDAFAPRVIFIKVENSNPVMRLYDHIYTLAGDLLPTKPERQLHPHITIATRDLSVQAFNKSFPVLKKKEFRATFPVHSIFLFSHSGRNWEILAEIPFKDNTTSTVLS